MDAPKTEIVSPASVRDENPSTSIRPPKLIPRAKLLPVLVTTYVLEVMVIEERSTTCRPLKKMPWLVLPAEGTENEFPEIRMVPRWVMLKTSVRTGVQTRVVPTAVKLF